MANKTKHILVVSDPPAGPGYLPRVRHLCAYLMRQGHDVTLLTEEYEPLSFAHSYPVKTIRIYRGGSFEWCIKAIWTLLTDWHNRVFARKALKIADQQYDVIICSTFNDFPLGAALRLAKRWNIPLICDIRDLDEQVDDSRYQYRHQSRWLMPFRKLYRAIHIRRRNRVLRAAKAVTTISPWHADFIRSLNPNVHIVYNGYDPEQFYPEDSKTDGFTITYIGSLFEWQQPALKKVQQALAEMDIPVTLDMHTPQNRPISHDQLGDAIRNSSMMLVLTNEHTHGMLTTKFYEALGCEKPILCVPSDHGALAELISYTNAGIATDDIEEIKAYISAQYKTWQQHGFTRQGTQHREEFSRSTQYAKIAHITESL